MIYELWKQWHKCRPILIEEVNANALYNEDDVLIGLATGDLKLWIGKKSALVTRLRQEPRAKVAECLFVGGEMNEIISMGIEIEKWAAEQGCSLVMHVGRQGWSRVMTDYDNYGVCLMKEL